MRLLHVSTRMFRGGEEVYLMNSFSCYSYLTARLVGYYIIILLCNFGYGYGKCVCAHFSLLSFRPGASGGRDEYSYQRMRGCVGRVGRVGGDFRLGPVGC